jgi:FkbM family methyltransferase
VSRAPAAVGSPHAGGLTAESVATRAVMMPASRLPSVRNVRTLAIRLLSDSAFRRYFWLSFWYRNVPRHEPADLTIAGLRFEVPDIPSFLSAYGEIFIDRIYDFVPDRSDPTIVDVGANVGVSVIFFKRRFPAAQVIALEPDSKVYSYLQRNLRNNRISGVTAYDAAAWVKEGSMFFSADGADGGHLSCVDGRGVSTVRTIDLPSLLRDIDVDLLKIDIEGAEAIVVPACREALARVRRIFVEYHSVAGEPQVLATLLTVLREAGFRIHVHSVHASDMPFLSTSVSGRFDLQLNVFAFRE